MLDTFALREFFYLKSIFVGGMLADGKGSALCLCGLNEKDDF